MTPQVMHVSRNMHNASFLTPDCKMTAFMSFFFFFKVERWEAEVTVGPIVVE